jgi:hypothetical protein
MNSKYLFFCSANEGNIIGWMVGETNENEVFEDCIYIAYPLSILPKKSKFGDELAFSRQNTEGYF